MSTRPSHRRLFPRRDRSLVWADHRRSTSAGVFEWLSSRTASRLPRYASPSQLLAYAAACTDTVGAFLVFLNLLVFHAEAIGEVSLRQAICERPRLAARRRRRGAHSGIRHLRP